MGADGQAPPALAGEGDDYDHVLADYNRLGELLGFAARQRPDRARLRRPAPRPQDQTDSWYPISRIPDLYLCDSTQRAKRLSEVVCFPREPSWRVFRYLALRFGEGWRPVQSVLFDASQATCHRPLFQRLRRRIAPLRLTVSSRRCYDGLDPETHLPRWFIGAVLKELSPREGRG
jgi:hypothetical protein